MIRRQHTFASIQARPSSITEVECAREELLMFVPGKSARTTGRSLLLVLLALIVITFVFIILQRRNRPSAQPKVVPPLAVLCSSYDLYK
jgi:hypothetical protein